MKAVRNTIAFATTLLLAQAAQAGIVLEDGTSYSAVFSTQETDRVKFNNTPWSSRGGSAYAGFYKLDVNPTVPDPIVTFCVELTDWIGGRNTMTYVEGDSMFSSSLVRLSDNQIYALDRLLSEFYVGMTIDAWVDRYGSLSAAGNHAAALQLAVWEIAHEDEDKGWDLDAGDFDVSFDPRRGKGLIDYATELTDITIALAELTDDLANDNLSADHLRGISGFFDRCVQDQVFFAPVPEPSFIGLQAVVLGALFVIRRRRR